MNQQRILIVLSATGEFQGASITTDAGDPQPVDLTALGALLPGINGAAIAKLETIEADHAAAIAAKDAELQALSTAFQQLESLRVSMVEKVSTALQSGDPEKFVALGVEFLTPEAEKLRAEKLAQFEALRVELGI